ncbi:hypothetical protein JAAARDRAFT_194733 [Jaapia argillacea MUCL 33604]|uniref:Uncharacterized protein n=1 Tax=Jaapia argillacea MUCL 33604 TaxID=933084 RepID=A0A067PSG3_9AGAM|nr:hypothetical protein JAAARDRAFT_194733 [Jaapia argillacea MUCL 33604]
MRFSFVTIVSAFFIGSALAGHNCKCQDSNGQYNELTAECCDDQGEIGGLLYYPGPNHQCTSPTNLINSGEFVTCCQSKGVGGAYCWD